MVAFPSFEPSLFRVSAFWQLQIFCLPLKVACLLGIDKGFAGHMGRMLQAYDDNQTQMTLDGFLSFSQRFAKIKSRRLQKAVAGITGVPSFDHTH